MYEIDGRSFCVHPSAAYGSHRAMFHQGRLTNCTKYQMLGTPSQYHNDLSCSKWRDIHCLWKCFKAIPRYMIRMGGARDSICLSIIGSTEPFSTNAGSQIARKMPHFGYPLSPESWMLNCNDRHPLPMSYFETSLRYIKQVGWASLCIFRHLWVSPSYIPWYLTLKSLTKCKFWVSPQYGKLGAELWGETFIAYELFQNLP